MDPISALLGIVVQAALVVGKILLICWAAFLKLIDKNN